MKTLRLFGLALMAVLLSVNLTSCSEDGDDPVKNIKELEGEWILLNQVYTWDTAEDGKGKEEWNYDFDTPEEGSEKLIITATDEEGIYDADYYFYRENDDDWHYDWGMTVRLDGKKLIDIDYEEDITEITSLTSDKLVLTENYNEDGDSEKVVSTYQKKN